MSRHDLFLLFQTVVFTAVFTNFLLDSSLLVLNCEADWYLYGKLSKIKKYESEVKKDCARLLYNAFVVLSHLKRSGLDIFFFLSLCFLKGRSEKIKSKTSLRQNPTEHWKQLEQIPSCIYK